VDDRDLDLLVDPPRDILGFIAFTAMRPSLRLADFFEALRFSMNAFFSSMYFSYCSVFW